MPALKRPNGPLEQTLALANRQLLAGKPAAAANLCRGVLRSRPDWPPALHLSALIASKSDDLPGAIKQMRHAIAADRSNAGFHAFLAILFREAGRLDEARAAVERAIVLSPHNPSYYYDLSLVKKFVADDPHLATMERLVGTMAPGSFSLLGQTQLNFAVAKAYDDVGRYDDAFRHLIRGNTLWRSHIAYDHNQLLDRLGRIRAIFDQALFDAKSGGGYRSPVPVFVVGMPRSGTTLVEQILASHPMVHGAGELVDLPSKAEQLKGGTGGALRYPEVVPLLTRAQLHEFGRTYISGLRQRARDALRITDKALSHFAYVGLIHLALPGAHIIHVKRDPLDTCISCYANWFERGLDFTYDLGELGRHYRAYAELMAHWREFCPGRILEVRYEAIVADTETRGAPPRRFLRPRLGSALSGVYENQRRISTASATQVRQPIYQSSRGRAEAYREHLKPLIAALGALALA